MNERIQNSMHIRKRAVVLVVLFALLVTGILQSQQLLAGIRKPIRVAPDAEQWLSFNPFTLTTDTVTTSGDLAAADGSLSANEMDTEVWLTSSTTLLCSRRPPIRIPYRPPLRSAFRPPF